MTCSKCKRPIMPPGGRWDISVTTMRKIRGERVIEVLCMRCELDDGTERAIEAIEVAERSGV